jgi:methylenetetrahydrofolate dehydrogenase (NADP+) / methenyltetrahydrofolate cyclohydrolase
VATITLDGKKLASDIKNEIRREIQELGIKPGLAVIVVGDDPASAVYVRNKGKDCHEVGFLHEEIKLPHETTEKELLECVSRIAGRDDIHGLIVQLPLPRHINEHVVLNAIPQHKDVDCFHPTNMGLLFTKKKADIPLIAPPCTAAAVIEILDRYGISMAGKYIVVIGRSNIVGKPLAVMMLDRDATVSICHSKTRDLEKHLIEADIIVAAVGVPKLVKEYMVSPKAVVIDVGINRDADGKLIGDVDYEHLKDKVHAITPVPGGVGPMTRAMLLKNTLKIAKAARK